jgi:catechol 2,3-dioxygenase-like lactoylglutathione lyase family enzyme
MHLTENILPVLTVSDLERSIRFYCEVLGFELNWGASPGVEHIAEVGHCGQRIMLTTAENGGRATLWVGVDDILVVRPRLIEYGATELLPPQNRPWAHEMRFADPDGHILWFGSEPQIC